MKHSHSYTPGTSEGAALVDEIFGGGAQPGHSGVTQDFDDLFK